MLFATKDVRVKLLPFDNKSEIQVVLDLPQGTSLEETDRALMAAAERLKDLPELTSIQAYAGTAAPFNFNGLVRHYYLRDEPQQGDLAVNLRRQGERTRASHAIALDIRHRLADLPLPHRLGAQGGRGAARPAGARRPCSPRSTAPTRRAGARPRRQGAQGVRGGRLRRRRRRHASPSPPNGCASRSTRRRWNSTASTSRRSTTRIGALIGGTPIGYSQRGDGLKPIDISVALPRSDRTLDERFLSTPLPAGGTVRQGANVELGDVVKLTREPGSYPIFRHNGRFAEMVTRGGRRALRGADLRHARVEDEIAKMDWGAAGPPAIKYHGQPLDDVEPTLLWDGEWEVTYVTFRDMGAAFMVAILGIYLLVVAQFGSFKLPLVILTPVPLTLIGIVLGHWLLGAPFTATSMIGFIALAGIIVRNSILLVDFIRRRQEDGAPLRQALIEAGATRFKPIVLTAAAAMIGAAFILADPIFQGLAISLVFGLASSTALTLAGDPGDLRLAARRRTPGQTPLLNASERQGDVMTQTDWPEDEGTQPRT